MKKKVIAGVLSGMVCISSMGIVGSATADSQDVNFFLDKIANTQDETKKAIGVEMLKAFVDTDSPNVSGLKEVIKKNAIGEEETKKLEQHGYTVDKALDSLDVLEKMSRSDVQSLIRAVETGDKNGMKTILDSYMKSDTPTTSSGGSTGAAGGTGTGTTGSAAATPATPETEKPASTEEATATESKEVAVKFADIENHWAKEDITFLAARGMIKGQSGEKFNPNGNITRAEFTALIVKLFDLKQKENAENIDFTDVKTTDWYFEIVKIGRQHGIVQGMNENQFLPGQSITREQMVTILIKALSLVEYQKNESKDIAIEKFEDQQDIAQWAQESVAGAVKLGVIKGKKENQFAPKGLATRAEAAAMMKRVFELL